MIALEERLERARQAAAVVETRLVQFARDGCGTGSIEIHFQDGAVGSSGIRLVSRQKEEFDFPLTD